MTDEYDDSSKILYSEGLIDKEEVLEKKKVKFIFLEDSDIGNGFRIVKKFLELIGCNDRDYKIINSKGDFDSVIKYLKKSREIDKLKFKALIIGDSDSLPDNYLQKIKEKYEDNDISMCFFNSHEIENYLLNARIILRTIKRKDKTTKATENKIKKIINYVVKENKDLIIDKLEGILQGKLKSSFREFGLEFIDIQSKTIEIKKDIRDNNFKFPYEKLPGKEIYKLLKSKIHSEYKQVVSELDVALNFNKSEIPKELIDFIKFFD